MFAVSVTEVGVESAAALEEAQAGPNVSLWLARLDVSASTLDDLLACLSPEERKRAERFHRPLDRERFVAARGWLRRLLASQLCCAPIDVRIVTDDRGKPRLANADLHFSASRSAGVSLYATSPTIEVGVDVEAIKPIPDLDHVATGFFSPAEQQALAALSQEHRQAAFFQCWTCKEAYVKGVGVGLDFPLHTVDVWAEGRQRATVDGWSVRPIQVPPGFAGAVAGADLDDWAVHPPVEIGAELTAREDLLRKERPIARTV